MLVVIGLQFRASGPKPASATPNAEQNENGRTAKFLLLRGAPHTSTPVHDPPLPPSHKLSQGCSKHGGRVCGNGTMAPKLDERPTPSRQRPHPRQPTPSSPSRKPCLRRQLGDCLFLLGLGFQGSCLWFRGLGFREFVHELFGGSPKALESWSRDLCVGFRP